MNKAVNVFLSSVVLLAATGELVNAATPGAYLGAGAGYSALEPAADAETLDEGGLGGRVFVGYNFNHYFGLESNYSTFFKTRYVLNDYQNVANIEFIDTSGLRLDDVATKIMEWIHNSKIEYLPNSNL